MALIVVLVMLSCSLSAWCWMSTPDPPRDDETVETGMDTMPYFPQPLPPSPPVVAKKKATTKPKKAKKTVVIVPPTFPVYPAGMYDWFDRDQAFYRGYPDQRWVVSNPWHGWGPRPVVVMDKRYRGWDVPVLVNGYPDKAYTS